MTGPINWDAIAASLYTRHMRLVMAAGHGHAEAVNLRTAVALRWIRDRKGVVLAAIRENYEKGVTA